MKNPTTIYFDKHGNIFHPDITTAAAVIYIHKGHERLEEGFYWLDEGQLPSNPYTTLSAALEAGKIYAEDYL